MRSSESQLLSETLDYDGGRQVTVYVPAAPPEAVVFCGDGQLIAPWGESLEAADLPSTMIIGVHRVADEVLRIHEYSPGRSTEAFSFDPERFAAHERFFVGDVRRWAQSRFELALPADRTAVFGVSASGELTLAMGLRHPEIYGAVLCASPGGGYRPPAVMPSPLPRTYLVAGRAGTVLHAERDQMGGCAAACRRRGGHDRAGRFARRRILERGGPADGGLGVWTPRCALIRRPRRATDSPGSSTDNSDAARSYLPNTPHMGD